MDKQKCEELWRDDKNWKGIWGVYSCPQDPRVVVPKRCKWAGWTVNFAHPAAGKTIFLFVLMTAVPTLLVIFLGYGTMANVLLALAASTVGLIILCKHLSSHAS